MSKEQEERKELIDILERIATALEDISHRMQLFGDYRGGYYKDDD